jgi:hypothetical protein
MILNCTDSAGGSCKGCAAIFGRKWVFMQWPAAWKNTPVLRDITYLELIPIALAIYLWGRLLKNEKVIFFCDNEAVVFILNNKSAKSERVMTLLRFVFYWTLKSNIQLKAKLILSSFNKFADYISRVQVEQFRMLAPSADRCPCRIPVEFLGILW